MNSRQVKGYAPWQLWDFAIDRGVPVLLVGGLLGLSSLWPMRIGMQRSGIPPETIVRQLLELGTSQIVTILVVIAISGIVANDRISGQYRFLFAKPVRVSTYYALQYAIVLVGLLAATLVLLSAFWLAFGWVDPWPALAMVVLTYLSLGATGFFFSTFTRFDWAMLVVLWGATQILRVVFPNPIWSRAARKVLPPTHHIDGIRDALFAGTAVDAGGVFWLVGYGLLFFVAGLYVLRRRALAD